MILLLIVSVGAGEEVPIPAGIRRNILIRMVLLSLSRTPDEQVAFLGEVNTGARGWAVSWWPTRALKHLVLTTL